MSPLWSPAFWLQTAVQSFCSLFSKHKGLSGYRPQCPRMFAENDLHAGSASPHRWSSCSPSPSSSHLLQLPFFPCCPLCGASTFHTIKKRSVLFFFFLAHHALSLNGRELSADGGSWLRGCRTLRCGCVFLPLAAPVLRGRIWIHQPPGLRTVVLM